MIKEKDTKQLKNGKEKGKKGDSWMVKVCSVCEAPLEEEDGDVMGYFGIMPIGFCVWCLSSVTDMVIQTQGFDDIDVLKERIIELGQEEDKRI